jgi:hypothetical protein
MTMFPLISKGRQVLPERLPYRELVPPPATQAHPDNNDLHEGGVT